MRIELAGPGERRGIVGSSVRDLISIELTAWPPADPSDRGGRRPASERGVTVDHLVVMSPALDRTTEVLRAAGLDFPRLREGDTPGGSTRQAFFRMGEVILEVVEAPGGIERALDPDGPAGLGAGVRRGEPQAHRGRRSARS